MSPVYRKSNRGLARLFEDHSDEGIAILTARPSRFGRGLILLLGALLVSAFVWSFFGRADVVVTAGGLVDTEAPRVQVYTPVKGELVNIFAAEGTPVAEGDVLFRVDSPGAIQMAGQLIEQQIALSSAEAKFAQFPEARAATMRQIEAAAAKIADDERELARLEAESIANLTEQQRLKLEKARNKLQKAIADRDHARQVLDSHIRLINSEGGGGISQQQVDEKRKAYDEKELDLDLARAELGEFEATMSEEFAKAQRDLEEKRTKLESNRGQYGQQLAQLKEEESKVKTELLSARARVRQASRVTLDDIDEDNYVAVRSPTEGVVLSVAHEVPGVMIEDKNPIVTIAPKDARKVVQLEIAERDRAFLEAGMPVKVKVNAFPYQRYGYLEGVLEHISPSATMNRDTKKLTYSARVGLEKDTFVINDEVFPVRFGMATQAEIIVRKRRIIDIALDPLRATVG